MRTTLLVLAAAGLSGCAVYPLPAYAPYGAGPLYGVEPPVYLYGGGVYRFGGYGDPHADPRGYNQVRPDAIPYHPQHRRARDRDRDGDGVPNRVDRQPHDPRFR